MARGLVSAMALAASVCGCSSGGGDGGGGPDFGINCAGLTGGTPSVSLTCTAGSCDGAFQDAAADGDLGTYAILSMAPNSAGSVSIRVTAAEGVTYPAGTPAAAVYGIQRDGESVNTTETISTYLDGALQQTGNANVNFGTTNDDVVAGRRAMGTNMDFDAIEVTYTQSGGVAGVEVQVYEFCTSTN